MASITFFLDDNDKEMFSLKVGNNNISESLRNYIKSVIEFEDKNGKETNILKQIKKIEKVLEQPMKEYNRLKSKLKKLEIKKQMDEEKKEKFKEEQKERFRKAVGKTMKDNLDRVV